MGKYKAGDLFKNIEEIVQWAIVEHKPVFYEGGKQAYGYMWVANHNIAYLIQKLPKLRKAIPITIKEFENEKKNIN